jgi:wyosine [tRNA(Phe)-imidazoG37] synthetase (radical SAM superfamily)
MNFLQAKSEFAVRYYLWGEAEFRREINESLPILRSFKTGRFWKRYRFMEQLDKKDQLILASGLLKKSNPDAVQIV